MWTPTITHYPALYYNNTMRLCDKLRQYYNCHAPYAPHPRFYMFGPVSHSATLHREFRATTADRRSRIAGWKSLAESAAAHAYVYVRTTAYVYASYTHMFEYSDGCQSYMLYICVQHVHIAMYIFGNSCSTFLRLATCKSIRPPEADKSNSLKAQAIDGRGPLPRAADSHSKDRQGLTINAPYLRSAKLDRRFMAWHPIPTDPNPSAHMYGCMQREWPLVLHGHCLYSHERFCRECRWPAIGLLDLPATGRIVPAERRDRNPRERERES